MKSFNLKKFAGISLLIMMIFASSSVFALAKDITITGKVTETVTNIPIKSVKVMGKGRKVSVLTDVNGYYTITIPKKITALVFEYQDSITKTVKINGRTVINVQLDLGEIQTDEIIRAALVGGDGLDDATFSANIDMSSAMKQGSPRTMGDPSFRSFVPSVAKAYNTEAYDVINENTFKAVKTNPLSTFSIDVDRASYSNVRRFLDMNMLPEKDVVRIEEMINYFEYDYPQPKGDEPFSRNVEMGTCPWNNEHYLVNIGLQGKDIAVKDLPASNLVLLLDVSGSMNSPNKLPLLKTAFKILTENLREKDRVAIVVYAGAAGQVLPSTSGANADKIMAALEKLEAGGSTAGGAGIELAYKIAQENFIKGGNNRVILATDGDFNIGQSSDAALVRMIEEKRENDIFLTVLGFGMGNYKDAKMEKLSNAGNGNYAYIDNVLEAKKTLGKEIWGTLYTIAKDVKIQIEFNPAKVKAYRLIGYENRLLANEDFNDDTKDAGEIGSGHTVTAIYEIIPASSKEKIADVDDLEYQDTKIKASDDIMTLKVRYKAPEGDTSKLLVSKLKGDNIKTKGFSNNFDFTASVAQFGMILRDSEFKGTANYENTLKLAKSAKGRDDEGYRAEFIRLIEIAEILAK